MNRCVADGCERPGRGNADGGRLCGMHYQRWAKYGSTELPQRKLSADGICTAEGCARPVRSANAAYCETHYYRLRRGEANALRPINTACIQCGGPLSTKQIEFCSKRCQTRSYRGVGQVKTCPVCQSLFEFDGTQTGCSKPCQQELKRRKNRAHYQRAMGTEEGRVKIRAREYARKARKAAVPQEEFDPAEIYERDGWKCQLCGGPVSRKAKWPHPKFPTLDHIVPIRDGGPHTRVNVQLAHLRCNLQKNAGPGGQLRLFG